MAKSHWHFPPSPHAVFGAEIVISEACMRLEMPCRNRAVPGAGWPWGWKRTVHTALFPAAVLICIWPWGSSSSSKCPVHVFRNRDFPGAEIGMGPGVPCLNRAVPDPVLERAWCAHGPQVRLRVTVISVCSLKFNNACGFKLRPPCALGLAWYCGVETQKLQTVCNAKASTMHLPTGPGPAAIRVPFPMAAFCSLGNTLVSGAHPCVI